MCNKGLKYTRGNETDTRPKPLFCALCVLYTWARTRHHEICKALFYNSHSLTDVEVNGGGYVASCNAVR